MRRVAAALANPNFHLEHTAISLREYRELTRVEHSLRRNVEQLLKDRKEHSNDDYYKDVLLKIDRKTFFSYNVKIITKDQPPHDLYRLRVTPEYEDEKKQKLVPLFCDKGEL